MYTCMVMDAQTHARTHKHTLTKYTYLYTQKITKTRVLGQLIPMRYSQTQIWNWTESKQPIKTIFTIKEKSRNLPLKSPEDDIKVWNTCSGQVCRLRIMIKKWIQNLKSFDDKVVHSINFQTGIWNCHRLLNIHYVIAIYLMRWLTKFYDFSFISTATAATGIHPTKAWLSQLVNFKNAIWTWAYFRRTICNKILF